MNFNLFFDDQRDEAIPYPPHPEDKIPKAWLRERITEEKMTPSNVSNHQFNFFGWHLPGAVTLSKMQPGDEIWSFLYSAPLASRAGVAIVRSGVIVHAELRMMS